MIDYEFVHSPRKDKKNIVISKFQFKKFFMNERLGTCTV